MDITLTRKIPIKSYETIMKLGLISNEHQFYIRVLELTQEAGFIDQRMINEKMLFRNVDNVLGKRILENLEKLELLQGEESFSYNITPKGHAIKMLYFHVNKMSDDLDLLKLLEYAGFIKIIGMKYSSYKFEGTEKGHSFFNSEWPRKAVSSDDESILERFTQHGYFTKNTDNTGNSFRLTYKLTAIGEYTLDTGLLRIPEEGYFIIHTTEDPLVPEKIIAYDRPKSNHSSEFREASKKRNNEEKKQQNQLGSVKWVKDMQKQLKRQPKNIKLVGQNYEEIQIYEIGDELSSFRRKIEASISLNVPVYGNVELAIKSSKSQNKELIINHDLNLDYDDILNFALKDIIDDIVKLFDEPTLLVAYSDLHPIEKTTFTKIVSIEKPVIDGYGQFDDLYLKLKIIPETIEDAVLWINWMIEEQVNHYIDETEYLRIQNECVALFEKRFEASDIIRILPTFNDFVRMVEEKSTYNTRKYWYVTAPQVLTLRR